MNDVGKAKVLSDYFSIEHRVDAGVHIELGIPLEPPGINDLQITEGAACFHLGSLNLHKYGGQMEYTTLL